MFKPNVPLLITDIETGGLDLSHPIIQIASIAYLSSENALADVKMTALVMEALLAL